MSKVIHTKFENLEGLRGLAAIAVVFHHLSLTFYPAIVFGIGSSSQVHSSLERLISGSPLFILLSGTFPVAIFFVLSGFVLSISYFYKKDDKKLKSQIIRRYPRLMIPALTSIIICFLLIELGLARNSTSSLITGSQWLLNGWTSAPNLLSALQEGFYGIFIHSGSVYNNVLWTMQTEFFGSLLVFILIFTLRKAKFRNIIYILLGIFLLNSWYLCFIAGVVLADIYSSKYINIKKIGNIQRLFIIIVIVYLAGFPLSENTYGDWYRIFQGLNLRNLALSVAAIL